MSRIGKKAILLPDGVSVTVNKNNAVVQGTRESECNNTSLLQWN